MRIFVRKRLAAFPTERKLLKILACFMVTFMFCSIDYYVASVREIQSRKTRIKSRMDMWRDQFLVDTPGCKLPYADPADEVIMKDWFVRNERARCSGKRPIFETKHDQNVSCPILREDILIGDYGARLSDLKCSYSAVLPKFVGGILQMNEFEKGPSKPLAIDECVADELAWIECSIKGDEYKQPLFNAVTKESGSARIAGDRWNVLVLGIDALSRLSYHRTMTETSALLKELYGENLVELKGYHKIGENSAPNQIPMLTGKLFLHETSMRNGGYFEEFGKFIWEEYKEQGFATMFAEEQMSYGLFTFPHRQGFRKIQTDFWPRPLMLLREQYRTAWSFLYDSFKQCLNGQIVAKHLLDYWSDVQFVSENQPTFTYLWLSEATHDSVVGGYSIDRDMADFFGKIQANGLLEKTVIFFLADHGYRIAPYRDTALGFIEDSLPFGFVLVPTSFREKFPTEVANLRKNAERLVTSYDLHESLRELAHLTKDGNSSQNYQDADFLDHRSQTQAGISLFSSVIPENRTCEQAQIQMQFCVCQSSVSAVDDVDGSIPTQELTGMIVTRINGLLDDLGANQCLRFSEMRVTSMEILNKGSENEYLRLAAECTKTGSKFEGFFRKLREGQYVLEGQPSRIDRYDKASVCALDEPYQRFCHCI